LITAPTALAAPGDLDPAFSGDGFDTQNVFNDDCGRDVAIQPDGKLVVVGSCLGGVPTTFSVLRYMPDGSPDQDFGIDGVVNVSFDPPGGSADERAVAVAVQPDGRIVVAGSSSLSESGMSAGGDNFAVARLLPGGALDASFNPNGSGANQDGRLVVNHSDLDFGSAIALGADGSIFVGGSVDVIADGDDFGVMKLTPAGVLDSSFDGDGKVRRDLGAVEELHAISPSSERVRAGASGAAASSRPAATARVVSARVTCGSAGRSRTRARPVRTASSSAVA